MVLSRNLLLSRALSSFPTHIIGKGNTREIGLRVFPETFLGIRIRFSQGTVGSPAPGFFFRISARRVSIFIISNRIGI